MEGSCKHGTENFGSRKCGKFLHWQKPIVFSTRILLHAVNY
jgi:hypothetical protein